MADEKTVKVTLKHSVGYRPTGAGGAPKLYGPGEVEVPESMATALGLKEAQEKRELKAKAAAKAEKAEAKKA